MGDQLLVVDKNDQAIGTCPKLEAHQKGLLHRAYSVFVFRKQPKLQLLLQQRHCDKYHCGSLWTNTCCSHPSQDSKLIESAQARLEYEMGFSVSLNRAGSFTYRAEFDNGLIEHEYDHVLVGWYQDQHIHPHPEEVQDYQWLCEDAIKQALAAKPESYTPWFKQAYAIALNYINNDTRS